MATCLCNELCLIFVCIPDQECIINTPFLQSGLRTVRCKICDSKMAKTTAIVIPRLLHGFVGSFFYQTGMSFLFLKNYFKCSFEIFCRDGFIFFRPKHSLVQR